MSIILTMDEVENVLKSCIEDVFISEHFKEITIPDINKISPSWKIYLNHNNLTIAEYNLQRADLNKMSRDVAQELMDELLKYKSIKKLQRRLSDLSKRFGNKVQDIYRDDDALITMYGKEFLKLQYANHFDIMLVMEINSRDLGYNSYKDLCDLRNMD